ncbi:MAG: hypothetical protein K8T91_27665 [Planctomycetes bacterium]|nr:hypothetical protein [Planctomycetota bacterium]
MQQDSFDPYRKWLGIAPKDQPPNLYRLLGIDLFESDPDVIANAADQRMTHVRTFQSGPNGALSQQILNEVSAARVCLLDDEKRAEYETELREKLEPTATIPTARAATPRPESNRWRDEPLVDAAKIQNDDDVAPNEGKERPLLRRVPQRPSAASNTRTTTLRKPITRTGSRSLPLLLGIGAVGAVVIGVLAFMLSQSPSGQQPLSVSTAGADTKTVPVSITKPAPPPVTKPPIPVATPPVVQPPPQHPRPPRIEPVGDRIVEAGKSLELTVRTETQEQPGRRFRFTLLSAPAGASIVEDMGIFRFVAPQLTAEQSSNVVVQVALADHPEQKATTMFQLRVRPAAVTPPPVAPIVRRPGFKSPVPSAEELAVQVQLLRTQYAAEYADASQQGRLALITKLRTEALRSSELTRRYAMLNEIRGLASANRDVNGAWQSIDLMEMTFDIDGTTLRTEAIQELMGPAEASSAPRDIAQKYHELLQRALWTGRFVSAEKTFEPALAAAKLSGDAVLQTTMAATVNSLRALAREEEAAEKAHALLEKNPNDAEANFLWGRFLCLMRNDFTQGLPLLAQGANKTYQSAAKAELATPVVPSMRKQAGDLWWDVQKEEGPAGRQRAMRRVMYWYGQARNGLDQAALAEINARQAEMIAVVSAPLNAPKIDKPAPEKPVVEKPAPIPPLAEKPPAKPPSKPGVRPEFKPLQGAALTTFVRAVLKSGGRVRVEGGSNWIWKDEELPPGDDLTVAGLALEKNVTDDAVVKNISRIHSLKELTLDCKGISNGAIHRLSDLTNLTRLELTAPRLTDSFITGLQEMGELRSLALRGDQLGGANLEVLSGLQLSSLEITGGRISEGTLVAVGKLEGLQTLMLRGGNYSPRAIDRLQALSKLTSLTLQAYSVNDQVVTHVADLNSLTRLTLEGPIAGATLPSLSKLENLASLSIISSMMEEKDLTAIGELSNLKRLTLKTKPLSNGALEKLSGLKKLESLDIQTKGGFNESGLKHFDAMPRLTNAHLAGLNISMEGYEKFKKDHPNTYLSPKPDWGEAIGEKLKQWKDREKGMGGPRRPPGRG